MQHLGKRRRRRRKKSESKSIGLLVDKVIYFLIGSLITFLFAAIFHFYIYNKTVDNYEYIISQKQFVIDDLNARYCRTGTLAEQLKCRWEKRLKLCKPEVKLQEECLKDLEICKGTINEPLGKSKRQP